MPSWKSISSKRGPTLIKPDARQKAILNQAVDAFLFLEPVLYKVWLSHQPMIDPRARIGLRCGQGQFFFEPLWLARVQTAQLREAIRIELIRILLRHPYERSEDCSDLVNALSSNITLSEIIKFEQIQLPSLDNLCAFMKIKRTDLVQHRHRNKEHYARLLEKAEIQELSIDTGDVDLLPIQPHSNWSRIAPLAQNWGRNALMSSQIQNILKEAESGGLAWGSTSPLIREILVSASTPQIDFRQGLHRFQKNITRSAQQLSRRRFNRRNPLWMGSKQKLLCHIGIYIDTSGSMSEEDLSMAFGAVRQLLRQTGIDEIDVIQFDTEIRQETKALRHLGIGPLTIRGRGGTNFDIALEHAQQQEYDGVIVITDGYSSLRKPSPISKDKICWLFNTRSQRRTHEQNLPGTHLWIMDS